MATDRIERYVALARVGVAWERIWPALWPASGFVAAFVALALFGAFAFLPPILHAVVLAGTAFMAGFYLERGFRGFRWPDWNDGARKLERDSGLAHRPITERDDRIALGAGDDWAEELWRAHMRVLLGGIRNLRLRLPSASLKDRDPRRLRYALLFFLAAGLLVARERFAERLAYGLFPDIAANADATMDAWINPPAYTGVAPVYLGMAKAGRTIAVPVNSQLVVRVHGAANIPHLAVPSGSSPRFDGSNEEFGTTYRLTASGDVSVRAGGRRLGAWTIQAIPDTPPHIGFSKPPSKTIRNALQLDFDASDDYGVTSARAIIRPVHGKHAIKDVTFDLPLASASRTVKQSFFKDMTSHPFAGLDVEITLEARDATGQTGFSKPQRFKLPALVFTNPLARALIEQRQILALDPLPSRPKVLLALDALTIAPERFFDGQATAFIAIRSAFWGLRNARNAAAYQRVEDLLWQTAVAIESGGLSAAAEELRRLQQLISEAMAQGAPQEVLDALMQRYAQAMQRYLENMARNPQASPGPLPPNAVVLGPDDLQKLLNAIQQLAQIGDREKAMQMLALLQSLLENLQLNGSGATGMAQNGNLDALRGLMDRQRQLLDKTYREQQGVGDPADGGTKGLSQKEGNLHQDLDKLAPALKGSKKAPQNLARAGKLMNDAQSALGRNDLDGAIDAERRALDEMRGGASALAEEMSKGRGQAQTGEESQDPLGRTNGTNGSISGNDVKVPDASSIERARSIIRELRRRAAERGRPKEELDYFDRLLKQF